MVVVSKAASAQRSKPIPNGEFRADARLSRYQQLAERLRSDITTNRIVPGDRLPPEAALAETHGVALGTVRQAISLLVDEGLVERRQGRGTFVVKPDFSSALARFFRVVDASGQAVRPRGLVRSVAMSTPPKAVIEVLGLSRGAAALNLVRHRVVDADVVLLEDIWLEPSRFATLAERPVETFEDLLYPQLERECGVVIAHAHETLSVGRAGPNETALGVSDGDPVVIVERVASGFDGVPVEWRRSVGNVDTFRYQVELR